MPHLAIVLALTSVVATAPAPSPTLPATAPTTSLTALVPLSSASSAPEATHSTMIRSATNAVEPKHPIVQFPWTRYAVARQQDAAMEAEIDAELKSIKPR